MASSLPVVRAAGLNEKRCIVRESLGRYNNIVMLGIYTTPSSPSKEDIIEAVRACLLKHPALSTVVQEADTEQPKLAHAKRIDIAGHVGFLELDSNQPDLKDILLKAHNEPPVSAPDQPQWRLYLAIRDGGDTSPAKIYAAFACSHALMDGISGYTFHKTFLHALRHPATDHTVTSSIFDVLRDPNPLPPMDSKLSISWPFLLGTIIKEYISTPLSSFLGFNSEPQTQTWLGAATRPKLSSTQNFPPTSLHIFSIQPQTLDLVLSKCRIHSTRLTSLLNHLFAKALSRSLSKCNSSQTYSHFQSQTVIDLRRALGVTDKYAMANYISTIAETIKISPASVSEQATGLSEREWESARNLTQRLAEASSTTKNHTVGLLKYLTNFREWTIRSSKMASDVSFEVSNVGVFDGEADGGGNGIRVERMIFSQSANGTGPPFGVNVASVKGGDLMMSVTWWEGMLGVNDERTFIEEICRDVVSEIEFISNQQ